MTATDHLVVIWGEPGKGHRHVIGHLARGGGAVRFWYEADLARATERGFTLLPEFPQHRIATQPYEAGYLFPLFAERIPAPGRADAQQMFVVWGVENPDDPFEVLAKSGGIRATDRIELAEHRAADDMLERPLELRVAGRRHIEAPAPLAIGDVVTLRRERDNEADSAAVVVNRDNVRAGYVPRQYTALVGALLDRSAALDARVVRKLLVPDDEGKWVVRLSRAG